MNSSLSPKKLREIVVQILYSKETGACDQLELSDFFMKEMKVTKAQISSACEQAEFIFSRRGELDEKIASSAASYQLERIGKVEKNILRLAVMDVLEKRLPPEVIIAEATRLTRKFCTDSSVSFVHAIVNVIMGEKLDHPVSAH